MTVTSKAKTPQLLLDGDVVVLPSTQQFGFSSQGNDCETLVWPRMSLVTKQQSISALQAFSSLLWGTERCVKRRHSKPKHQHRAKDVRLHQGQDRELGQ